MRKKAYTYKDPVWIRVSGIKNRLLAAWSVIVYGSFGFKHPFNEIEVGYSEEEPVHI